jgi:hypothetical protein
MKGNTSASWRAAASWALCAIAVQPAIGQSACQAVYSKAVANTAMEVRQSVVKRDIFDQHCEANGEIRSASTGFDLTIPVKALKIGFSGNRDEARQEMQQFCKTYSSNLFQVENMYSYERQVVVAALNSFNDCLAFEAQQIKISHTFAWPLGFTIATDLGRDKKVTVRNVQYDEAAGECYFTGSGSGTKRDVIKPGLLTARTFENYFSVACDRKPLAVGGLPTGDKKYPAMRVVMDTSSGRYAVEMPADEVHGYESALAAKDRYAQLETAKEEVVRQRQQLEARIKGYTQEIRTVTQTNEGQPRTLSRELVGCTQTGNSLDAYAQAQCGPGKVVRTQIINKSGSGLCGADSYVYTCSTF